MLSISLSGNPFDRGFEHGRKFAHEIKEEIDLFVPRQWRTSGSVNELQKRLLSSLSSLFPELLVEMVGISHGSGIEFEDIALLNLTAATNDLESDAISSTFHFACTAIGHSRSDIGPIVAKNCDERLSLAPFYLFQTVYPQGQLAFMGISNVGTLWLEGGMNEAGLGLMQTAGPTKPDQDGYGIACNIVPRTILARCRTTSEAVEMLKSMFVAGWGMGVVLADPGGHVVAMEKTGDLCAIRPENDGAAFCTNHFIESEMADAQPIAHEGLEENSRKRFKTLQALYYENNWPRTVEGIKDALGYHGTHGFVCQHGDVNLHSNYSCIALLCQRKILLGDGYPCQENYKEYQF